MGHPPESFLEKKGTGIPLGSFSVAVLVLARSQSPCLDFSCQARGIRNPQSPILRPLFQRRPLAFSTMTIFISFVARSGSSMTM
jgi:hypothetical protein